ncbi:outer membrane-stress sensor serine endopeptidase DegS [Shewanella sp.]|uniref:outer membrane-stress sensor serine endopeptidase DegS n=1 Tax=Shewanella sp. TaxID=50422 RepID=UPI003A98738A
MIKDTLLYLGKAIAFGLVMAAVVIVINSFTSNNLDLFSSNNPLKRLSFNSAVRTAAPAVVNIYNLGVTPNRPLNQGKLQGLGSGVIMRSEGYILTNFHVVRKADEIVVALQDGRKFSAEVVGLDPDTDLAVLKIEGEKLPTVHVNLKTSPNVGDIVLAIGNPYNIGQTITQGIISATGRSGLSTGYLDFIQTDAAINAGNSGGALIDTTGSLIGINTAAYQLGNEGGGHGINFAIPIKLAYTIMNKLIKDGRVIRGALGVSGEELDPFMGQMLNIPNLRAVVINTIDSQGAAAAAGLRVGDVIVKYQGEPVTGSTMLLDRIAETTPNTKVTLQVVRNGKLLDVPVVMGEKAVTYNSDNN